MKTTFVAAILSLCLLTACSKSSTDSSAAPETNNFSSGNPVTAPVDYLGAVNKAQKNSVKTIDLSSLKQAINLFYGTEGRYPESLQELVDEKFIGAIPKAPAGQQFTYNKTSGDIRMEPVK